MPFVDVDGVEHDQLEVALNLAGGRILCRIESDYCKTHDGYIHPDEGCPHEGKEPSENSEESCHCGHQMLGSDHCPECYCEQHEKDCGLVPPATHGNCFCPPAATAENDAVDGALANNDIRDFLSQAIDCSGCGARAGNPCKGKTCDVRPKDNYARIYGKNAPIVEGPARPIVDLKGMDKIRALPKGHQEKLIGQFMKETSPPKCQFCGHQPKWQDDTWSHWQEFHPKEADEVQKVKPWLTGTPMHEWKPSWHGKNEAYVKPGKKFVDYPLNREKVPEHRFDQPPEPSFQSMKKAKITLMPLADLHPLQTLVDDDKVQKLVDGELEKVEADKKVPPPMVIKAHDGTHYIRDGHHRLAAAHRSGLTHFPVRLMDQCKPGEDEAPFLGFGEYKGNELEDNDAKCAACGKGRLRLHKGSYKCQGCGAANPYDFESKPTGIGKVLTAIGDAILPQPVKVEANASYANDVVDKIRKAIRTNDLVEARLLVAKAQEMNVAVPSELVQRLNV